MIHIPVRPGLLPIARQAHSSAIISYIKGKSEAFRQSLFYKVTAAMPCPYDFHTMMANDDWSWLSNFILADIDTLRSLTASPSSLQFEEFKKLYLNRFSRGSQVFVDPHTKYNAYTFIKNIGITVCPYCDEEYLDVIPTAGGKTIRTLEIDHFFPKDRYPALAMCFYNLVPSGQSCNGLKLAQELGMSPYEENIEACTRLYPDLPVGVNMETVDVQDCTIHFHPTAGMIQNTDILHLEARYERHKGKAHKYLLTRQQFDDAKVEEMVRLGFFPSVDAAYRHLYDEPLADDGEQQLLTKLKKDLTGR